MKKHLILFILTLFAITANAQDGKLNQSYVPQSNFDRNTAVARLTDGSLIVGGVYNVQFGPNVNIEKLNPNGSIASTSAFNFTYFDSSQVTGEVKALCVLPDGDILVGGSFNTVTMYNFCIFRINSNGSYDTGFATNLPAGFVVNDIKIQPVTNKILVGGYGTGQTANKGLYRLNLTGSIDTTFNNGGTGIATSWSNELINDIETYPNGDMIIAGDFSTYNGSTRVSLAKINSNGTLNSTSFPGYIFGYVDAEIDNSGNILAVDLSDATVHRFFPNGTLDTSFNVDIAQAIYPDDLYFVKVQADGKILLGGNIYYTEGVATRGIIRVFADGSLDTCFDSTIAANYYIIYDILIEPDGNLIVWGDFPTYDNIARPGLAKVRGKTTLIAADDAGLAVEGISSAVANVLSNDSLNGTAATTTNTVLYQVSSTHPGITLNTSTGTVNITSSVPAGTYTLVYKICEASTGSCVCETATVQITVSSVLYSGVRADAYVRESGLQSDGNIIICGGFQSYDNTYTNTIARLKTDLSLDTSFNASGPVGTYPNYGTHTFVIQPNDYIVVAGAFQGYSGQNAGWNIARLKPDGNFDASFNVGNGFTWSNGSWTQIISLALQPNGKILAGGKYDLYNGISTKGITRLNSDGSYDYTFNSGSFVNNAVDIALQPNGYILVTGNFLTAPSTTFIGIARLKPDGSIDPSFHYGVIDTSPDADSEDITLQPDGKIIYSGRFTTYNGQNYRRIVRLNPDGSIDPSFNIGTGFNNRVYTVTLDDSGKILVGGDFTSYNGQAANRIARLNPDGSFDTTFDAGTGPNYGVMNTPHILGLTMQPDGKVIIAGDFKYFDGIYAGNVTRLIPDYGVQGRPGATENIFEEIAQGVTIYPNPSNGIFNLQVEGYDGQAFELEVYNALGQLVLKSSLSGQSAYQIDLSTVETGNYFVRMQNNNAVINKIIAVKR